MLRSWETFLKLSSKLESYSQTLSESAGCLTGIGVLLVTLAASQFVFQLAEYFVINHFYGHAAWVGGLRVIDGKHGTLSNGDFLTGWAHVAYYMGSFILIV